jgi:YesN/AraC family two-component response regulator
MPEPIIKIALAEDHNLVRKGLISIINSFPNKNVILEASNGKKCSRC